MDSIGIGTRRTAKIGAAQILNAPGLANGRVWYLVLIYFGLTIGVSALQSWGPQLVKSLSSLYSNSMVGLLLAIPNPGG